MCKQISKKIFVVLFVEFNETINQHNPTVVLSARTIIITLNVVRSRTGVWKLCDFGSSVQGNVDIGTGLQRANEEEVIQR